jgi:hypothetical protein
MFPDGCCKFRVRIGRDTVSVAPMGGAQGVKMTTIYTVRPAYLVRDAEQIERDAEKALRAWILLGQSERYGEAMRTARALRAAAAERSVAIRREILRNSGFTVRLPRDVR